MGYLTEREWVLLNGIIKEIYCAETLEEFSQTFLGMIRKLIPYRTASVVGVREDGSVEESQATLIGGDQPEDVKLYNERYVQMDYTNPVFGFPKSTSFRDVDMVNEEEMKKTRIYREFFAPRGKKYSGGLVIKSEQKTLCITLYRDEMNGALTEKEIFILEQFIGHIENIIRRLSGAVSAGQKNHLSEREEYRLLTERERQILPYLLKGYTNQEIGKILFISESTVKKHVYHIMEKLHMKSRGELIRRFAD